MKKILILLVFLISLSSFSQITPKDSLDYPYRNSEFSSKKNYEVMSNFPAEQDLEEIYGKAALFQDFGDEFYEKGMIDSAQVYYAKSALVIDPGLIYRMYPEIQVIMKDKEAFEKFSNNKDSVKIFIKNAQIDQEFSIGKQELAKKINSLPEAVAFYENVAYRNDRVNMEVISTVDDDLKISYVRWGRKDTLPWTPIYPDTTLSVARAWYSIKYKYKGKEEEFIRPCSGDCIIKLPR